MKINVLNKNLANYTSNVEQAVQEISRDLKSLKSSSRANANGDTDRNSRRITSKMNESQMPKDISEQTLKTIMDFKSERAQTQHRNQRKSKT